MAERCTQCNGTERLSRFPLMLTRQQYHRRWRNQRPSTTSAAHWENNADHTQVVCRSIIPSHLALVSRPLSAHFDLSLPCCPAILPPDVCSARRTPSLFKDKVAMRAPPPKFASSTPTGMLHKMLQIRDSVCLFFLFGMPCANMVDVFLFTALGPSLVSIRIRFGLFLMTVY